MIHTSAYPHFILDHPYPQVRLAHQLKCCVYCRTIYQKLLFDKEVKIKIEQRGNPSAALPGIEPKIESAQEEELQSSRTEAKKQRVSSSPSADSGNIDLAHSEDQESAQRSGGLLGQFER